VHSAKPEHFGTYLHPNSLVVSSASNSPCSCSCTKCLPFNRPNLSKGKISKIKRRVEKVLKKIDEREHSLSLGHQDDEGSHQVSSHDVESCTGAKGIPPFTNLTGLRLVMQSTNFLHVGKKMMN